MACYQREQTGSCNHHQCQFSSDTDHGYECVELASGFCECGEDCLAKCPHSWRTSARAEQADTAFRRKYPEIKL
jgi:hypothetical protein